MKWAFAISLFLALAVGLIAQDAVVKVDIPQPGQRGMISVAGRNDLNPGDVAYLKNMVLDETYGNVVARHPLRPYGTNTKQLYGATGFYDPFHGWKCVVGIADSIYTWYDSNYARTALLGQFYRSDTFGTNPTIPVWGSVFGSRTSDHFFTPHLGSMICTDGENLPALFTLRGSAEYLASVADTSTFQARVFPVGLPAPGQLTVGFSSIPATMRGNYQYAYAFLDTNASSGNTTDSTSDLSLPSSVVFVDGYCPYITGFDPYIDWDGDSLSGGEMGPLVLCRKKLGGKDIWNTIDTIFRDNKDSVQLDSSHTVYVEPVHRTRWSGVTSMPPACLYPSCSTCYSGERPYFYNGGVYSYTYILALENAAKTDTDSVSIALDTSLACLTE